MKFLDKVSVINDKEDYKKENVFKGMQGTIIDAEIRDNCFNVIFVDERVKDKTFMSIEENLQQLKDDVICPIKIEDLKLVEDMKCSDQKILESIPLNNPKWWCKVENGYIVNLEGEKKNKIPFDYKS